MGDGVNIAARLEGIAKPGAICLSEDAYRQVKGRLDLAVTDLGPTQLKNIAEPIRVYSLQVGARAGEAGDASRSKRSLVQARSGLRSLAAVAALLFWSPQASGTRRSALRRDKLARPRGFRSSCCRSKTSAAIRSRNISPTASPTT